MRKRVKKKSKAGDFTLTYFSFAKALTPLFSFYASLYSFPQPWPSVSNLAKDFIQRLLFLDPATRLTADQATHHPWVATMAASSSMRNLHRSISQNLRQRPSRRSTQCPSRTRSSADRSSSVPNGLMSPALEHHGGASGVSSAKM